MPEKTFRCSVVTPEGPVYQGEATFVAFPAHDGEVGILAERAPLLCRLGAGELRLQLAEQTHSWFIEGGFAQMLNNELTILTKQAVQRSSLHRDEVQKLLEQALRMEGHDEASARRRAEAIAAARARMRLAVD